MKLQENIKSLFKQAFILLGFLSFIFHLGILNPVIIFTASIVFFILFMKFILKKDYLKLLLPLASGILCFVNRLFYWDRVDFDNRNSILLLVSLIFIAVLIAKELSLIKRFLFYFHRQPLKKRLLIIFFSAEILFILAAFILMQKGIALGGDEPHYLVISQSIAKDGDLNVFNQYARDEYRQFIDVRLQHHARVGKGFKVWYSYGHLPGLSLTLAPFFLLKIPNPLLYFLIRVFLGVFGALLALLIYLFTLKLWKRSSLALIVTTIFTLTAPIFFYSIHIFAEVQATLLVLYSLYLLLFSLSSTASRANKKILTAGFLLGISVFWGLKYAIFIFLFSAGFFIYLIIKKQPKRAILVVIFPVLFQILFFGYLYYAYGNVHPMSIYNGIMTPEQIKVYESNMEKIPLQKRVETLLGIFFDQRDGLLLYNPFYFLAFPGLLLAIRKFKKYWPHLLISCAGFAFILFLGYSTVRPGYCPQARYLTSATWLLMLYAIIFYKESKSPTLKKLFFYLPVYSIFVTIYQIIHPFTLYEGATHINLDRPALLFQQWSNIRFNIPVILPSFIKVPGNFKYLPNIVFLILFVTAILYLFFKSYLHKNLKKPGQSSQKLMYCTPGQKKSLGLTLLFIIIYFIAVLFPRIPIYNPILITKTKDFPLRIYGKSRYPTRAEERKFLLNSPNTYSFTASTLKPSPVIAVEIENHEEIEYKTVINNFDKTVENVTILPHQVKKVYLKNLQYKSYDNTSFYRFHVKIKPSPEMQTKLFLQIYPLTKKHRQ